MKYLNILLFLLMIPFIGVQYNDPDGLMWALIYLVPLAWIGLAAFRLQHILSNRSFMLMGLSVAGMLILTVFYWPTTPGFWQKDVWWETETAREGMGMMIASFVNIVAALSVWLARKKQALSA